MDAVEFLKEWNRMTGSGEYGICKINCCDCPLYSNNNEFGSFCLMFANKYFEEAVAIVKKWSAEHPKKTRRSEFLKMFPNASIVDRVPELNPCHVDNKFSPQKGCGNSSCGECRKEYWNEEVE